MILGLLSDTHGRVERAARAVALLRAQGAEAIIHCGDVGGDGVFAELAAAFAERPPCSDSASHDAPAAPPVWFVWGNCDIPNAALLGFVRSLDLPVPNGVPLRLELAGRRIAVFHGHEREMERFDPTGVDYVLHGHTHIRRDERIGPTRVINPGALHRAAEHTVATLDLTRDALRFHRVA